MLIRIKMMLIFFSQRIKTQSKTSNLIIVMDHFIITRYNYQLDTFKILSTAFIIYFNSFLMVLKDI
jgi:hypothetical protein